MDEETVKAMLAAQASELTDKFNASLSGAIARTQKEADKRIGELQAQLYNPAKPESKSEPNESSLKLTALEQQLEAMKSEREQDKAQMLKAKRASAIAQELGGRSLVAPGTLNKLLAAEYGDKLQEEGGSWYVKDGDSAKQFSTVVDELLSSKEGLIFSPPASAVKGAGNKPGNAIAAKDKQSLAQQMEAALKGRR